MEETLLTIKRRYLHERAIYTWCGIALVAVNPYREQDIYGDQVIEAYHSASHSVYLQLDPHIYAITEDAFSKLERNLKNQSIIVSGESGAGKTVSAKHAMRYLASIASSKTRKVPIENRVLASNPIMEAIGNASTFRNDNSSRFGKYIQIFFDRYSKRILGANMRTYLLEKSRVTNLQPGERNFHIFYQLLNYAYKNPTKLPHLKLVDSNNNNQMRKFKYLGKSEPQDNRDELMRFNDALRTLNIDERRVDMIYRLIAGILHGGNIEFRTEGESGDDYDANCAVDPDDFHLNACCDLIGLNKQVMLKRLTTKLLRSGRDIIEKPQNRVKAEYCRDAMFKYVYECLFTWLVGLINLSLRSEDFNEDQGTPYQVALLSPKSPSTKKSILDANNNNEPQFIGVLDIYGFENFRTNSFEQFCINYANEVLQQQYNQHVFKLEQEEYIREGIDWTFIEYSDNQPVIDVIESRPIGILNLLDEECRMPKGTDKSWCAKLYDQLLTGKNQIEQTVSAPLRRPKLNYQDSFMICHYAEQVVYDVETFLEKNRDTIAEEQSELLRSSEVISYIFEDPLLPAISRPQPKTSRSTTVGCQFRGSLAALILTLNATEPHYIRCIKPNDEKKAFYFNEQRAIQQLKACGVYETIRISNNGFPSRWLYRDFAMRYNVLIFGTPAHSFSGKSDVKSICDAICKIAYDDNSPYSHIRTKEEQQCIDKLYKRHGRTLSAIYQFGKSKIFFRAGQVGYLERVRSKRLRFYAVTIQRHVRGWLARISVALKREQMLEQLRREASLASLQSQVASLRNELDLKKEEKEQEETEAISRMGSLYRLVVAMMYSALQPMVIGAVLEYEAIDRDEDPSMSLRSSTPRTEETSMEDLIRQLDYYYDLIKKSSVPDDITVQAFKQIFYLICAQCLNQMLIRRDLCQFEKGIQISFNLFDLVHWCREHFVSSWRDIVEQLDPIMQATKLLQTRKSSNDLVTIEEVCNKLRSSQIIKILNMYSSKYDQITTEFMEELEQHLEQHRSLNHDDLLMDTKHFFNLLEE